MQPNQNLRLSLPSKGRLQADAIHFLAEVGLSISKPNPRQYEAELPALPELGVIFQRPGDIVVSVRQGSVDFGVTELTCWKKSAAKTARSSSCTMRSASETAR